MNIIKHLVLGESLIAGSKIALGSPCLCVYTFMSVYVRMGMCLCV